ncbi:hypothetical protein ERJ75_000937300 [Trypanosoma vivax]|nr:hypothetical protein TRVL_02678 [Trypanosoma vivax]KAH8611660.1 hypothetical protein ERJ75_000937300 [Trypanosoma vivax]
MDVASIGLSFQRCSPLLAQAVSVLFNYARPLSRREAEALTELLKRHEEGLCNDGELRSLQQLMERPLQQLPAVAVFQCVLGAAKIPGFPMKYQRRLQRQLIHQVAKSTPLTHEEWRHVLLLTEALPMGYSLTALRCAEEVLKACAPTLFSKNPVGAGVGVLEEVNMLFLGIFASVVKHYAKKHAASSKHSFFDHTLVIPTGNANFLTSDPMRRLQRILTRHCSNLSLTWHTVIRTLPPEKVLTLSVASPWPCPVSRDVLVQVVKSFPTLLLSLLGRRPPPSSMLVENPDDVMHLLAYNMSLTTCSSDAFRDYLAVFMALPEKDKANYFRNRGKDGFFQLLIPYVNNPKSLTVAAAYEWKDIYAIILHQTGLEEELLPLFVRAAAEVVQRGRTALEKAPVMIITSAVIRAASESSRPKVQAGDIVRIIERELLSPSSDAALAAWRLLRASGVEEHVVEELRSAVNSAKSTEHIRRAMVLHLSADRTPADIIDGLMQMLFENCEEFEVYRPDAFLALRFVARGRCNVKPSVFTLLSQADVLSQIGESEDELDALAETAIALAGVQQFSAITLLLTHRSGLLRRRLAYHIGHVSGDRNAMASLWASITRDVFGLEAKEPPKILSCSASDALRVVASALLGHATETLAPAVVREVILCCGHNHIQGEDPYFFDSNASLIGRARRDSLMLCTQVFDKLFTKERMGMVTANIEMTVQELCEALHRPLHICTAASRGLVLLLGACLDHAKYELVFYKLLDCVKESVEYMFSLDARDRAIAAASVVALLEYEEFALSERQLIKKYPMKPPKGMSEDEFEDMKRRDNAAMEKGRHELRLEIERRRREIEDAVCQHKAILVTVRTLGGFQRVPLECISTLFPYLQATLCREDVPEVLEKLIVDAVAGLLSRTVLAHMAENMVRTVANLDKKSSLNAEDVSRVSTIALYLRQVTTKMLPEPLFVVLLPFARVAFKVGSGRNATQTTIPLATQHQILGLLMQNIGQAHLPQPTETTQLLYHVLQRFPSLFKSVQQGINRLMSVIPESHFAVLELGLFSDSGTVKEITAAAYHRFAYFAFYRRALTLAAVFTHDTSVEVVKSMQAIVSDPVYNFALRSTDWEDLLYFLKTYGQQQKSDAIRVGMAMRELFRLPSITEAQQQSWLKEIFALGGLASVAVIEALSPVLESAAVQDSLSFLCRVMETPNTEPLMRLVLSCGRVVLRDCSIEVLSIMSGDLQTRLSKPPKDITPAHKELYLAISTVWMTVIGRRLEDITLLESIVTQQGSTLNNSNSLMVHRTVSDSMVEITRNKDVASSTKLDEFVDKCVKQIINSGSYIKKKAHAYGLAGVLHGIGLTSLRRYSIIETMQSAAKQKQPERSGVMILLEVMCEVMGAKFEPYALSLANTLLEGVADKDPKVAECADDASRVMVRSLTAVGLRQLIPYLTGGLSATNAKMRIPPLNFIGNVAFCAPQQLAATLPEITKHINTCLFDVNHNVSTAAVSALRRVAGVVSNVEIKEHIEIILAALRSPNTETENALDALLYTRFVNSVDPASLALIIPILMRGLSSQMPHTRPKAAQIVASMVNLVNDPKSLKPYSANLVSLLEEAAEDPRAESRTTSAKAVAALASAIGGSMVDDIVSWCFTNMKKSQGSSVEKAGAAQVFVELVESCGSSVLHNSIEVIRDGMTDERPTVREGFLHILVFAPSTFNTQTFQMFLPVALPWVLEGLSHFSDRVRDVALAAGSSIVNLHGAHNLQLVLEPLTHGVVSEVTTLRHSCMLLTSKLLLHVVNNVRKEMRIRAARKSAEGDVARTEELEKSLHCDPEAIGDDEAVGILQMESARSVEKTGVSLLSALEESLGTAAFTRLLSAMYCGRNEHNSNVRTEANNAWQACVASPSRAVKKIFNGLVDMLIIFAPSENPDCVEMVNKTIEFTSRLSEVVEPFIDALCSRYKSDSRESKLGALTCLTCLVGYVDNRRLVGMGGQIVGCVLPGMQEKDAQVQQCARGLFAKVSKALGPGLIESVTEAQLETSVRGVVEVVKVKPGVALEIVFNHLSRQTTYTQRNLELLDRILDVEEAEEQMRKYIPETGKVLLAFLVQQLDGAGEVYQKFIEYIGGGYEHVPQEQWKKALRTPATRRGALAAAEAFGLGIDKDCIEGLSSVFRVAIESLGSDDHEVRQLAASMIPKLFTSLEERVIDALDEEERRDVTASKRAAGRHLLQFMTVFQETVGVTARSVVTEEEPEFEVLGEDGSPRLFDVLMAFYNRSLDYGTPMQKVQAVECIQDLLTYAPRRVSAGAVNTVAGRCSKVLFTRNEGSVVLAVVRLCLQLMAYPASGKEAMVEGTMALAMFNAALCDVGEARVLALRVAIQLLQRSEKYAELILGTVVTRKSSVNSALLRGVMCRFISVVMRYGDLTKPLSNITKLMDIVRPIWELAETPATAASAGVAVAALCKSSSVTPEQLDTLQEMGLNMMTTKRSGALGGFAFAYSLVMSRVERVGSEFVTAAINGLYGAASFGVSDKLSVTWVLRAAAALVSTGFVGFADFRLDLFLPLLRRIDTNDEVLMSTAQYFYDVVTEKYPSTSAALDETLRGQSAQWVVVGRFDADLDDEVTADSVY